MKKLFLSGLLLLALLPFFGEAQFIQRAFAELILPPPPDGYILDEAEILSEQTEAEIQASLAALEASNSVQMVVVTINSLQGYEPEQFALQLGREWGVGQDEFNNGLVFLIAPNERLTRIEVGYGLEGAITDAQSFRIIDEVALPLFSAGNYDEGVLQSVIVLEKLARGEVFDLSEFTPPGQSQVDFTVFDLWAYFFLASWAVLSWLSRTKSWWIGGIVGGIMGLFLYASLVGVIVFAFVGLFLDFMVSKFLFWKIPSGTHRGGFWGGGGRSGGGGGFGGGGFGGGGASGGW